MRSFLLFLFAFSLPMLVKAQTADRLAYQLSVAKPLAEVFTDLENTYGWQFSYAQNTVNDIKVGPCKIAAGNIKDLLSELLLQYDLEFRLTKNQEVLVRPQLLVRETKEPGLKEIRGAIIQQPNGQPLPYVAVYLDTLSIGMISDEKGQFSFSIPVSLQHRKLFFQLIGYQTQRIPINQVDELLQITMIPDVIRLDSVIVTETVPPLKNVKELSAIELRSLHSNGTSSVVGQDLFKTIQLLPGISAHDELSSSIKIRGSSGDETLIMVDGIPIYKAEHFFGVFSAINSNYVESTTLFKNTLPISFGGKTGGMLLMESNEQQYSRTSLQADINLLTSSLVLKTPLTDKVALILSGRTTYQDAASNPIFDAFDNELSLATQAGTANFTRPELIETVPSFRFYDVNAKLKWEISPKSNLDLNFFHSSDDLLNEYENSFLAENRLGRLIENTEYFSNSESWENIGSSLNYHLDLNNHWNFASSFYSTQYKNNGLIVSSLSRTRFRQERELFSFENRQSNKIFDVGWRNQVEKQLENKRSLTLGTEFIQHDNEFDLREENKSTFIGSGQSFEVAIFGSLPIVNLPDFHLDFGTRATYFSGTDQVYLSPRLNLYYQASPNIALKGAAARSNQFVREIVHENRLGQTMEFFLLSDGQEYPVGVSNQFMLGTNIQFGRFNFDLELYHKDHQGLIEHSRVFPGFNREEDEGDPGPGQDIAYQVFQGDGTTQGLDFLLRYEQNAYQGWISYTLSKTEQRFAELFRNAPFPSNDDRRHQFSWVNTYKLGKLDLSANYVFASGRPFSDLRVLERPADIRNLDPDLFFDRLPAYHRFDLGVSYNFNIAWTDCSLGVSMFNVTNHANVAYQQFIYSIPVNTQNVNRMPNRVIGTTTRMLDRMLNLNFNVRF